MMRSEEIRKRLKDIDEFLLNQYKDNKRLYQGTHSWRQQRQYCRHFVGNEDMDMRNSYKEAKIKFWEYQQIKNIQ
jgi:hypothetical protein